MFKYIKNKKGSSTIYELLVSLTLLTFVVMFPIGLHSYLHKINQVDDIMSITIQSMEQNGRFDEKLYDVVNNNLEEKGLPKLGTITESSATEQHSYLLSNLCVSKIESNVLKVVNKPGIGIIDDDTITITMADKVTRSFTGQYAMKYRNAYSFYSSNAIKTYYDVYCNCVDKHIYLTKEDIYSCPYCGKVSDVSLNREAQVVSATIYVPVSKQLGYMAKLIRLLSIGTIDTAEVFNEMGNIQQQIDGNFYFVKTYYGISEPYYFVGKVDGAR